MLKEAINRGYATKEPTQWPTTDGTALDRSKYVTASEIGQCERKTKFDKMALIASGYSPEVGTEVDPKQDWGFFERGHTMEAWMVDMLLRGWDEERDGQVIHLGKDQVSFVDGYQSGTPDGVRFHDGKVSAIEFKSIDPRTNVKKLPKPMNIDQVMQNVDLLANHYSLAAGTSHILYVDASNYKTMAEYKIEFDYDHAERLEEKAERIMRAGSPADLKAEGMFIDRGCEFCAHTVACNKVMREAKGIKDTDNNEAGRKLFGSGV